MTTNYAGRVGERLRNVRKQQRLSLQAVEAASNQEFKASVLGAYERGERAISVPRLQRLAHFYNVPVEQLLPPEDLDIEVLDLTDRRLGRPRPAPRPPRRADRHRPHPPRNTRRTRGFDARSVPADDPSPAPGLQR